MCADPVDRTSDPRQLAIGARDLPKHIAVRALQDSEKYLALDHWRQHENLVGANDQAHHAKPRIHQLGCDG